MIILYLFNTEADSTMDMDNPMYDTTGLPMRRSVEGERDLDNPIYGLPDDSSTSEMITGIDHYDVVYTSIL